MALFVAAATARASGLRAARGRRIACRPADDSFFFLRGRQGLGRRCGGSLFGAACLFLSGDARLLDGCFFGLAILFRAATLFLALRNLRALFAAARFLGLAKAIFFG